MFCVALNFPPLLSHSRNTRSSKGAKQKERRQIDLHAWSSIDLRPRRSKQGNAAAVAAAAAAKEDEEEQEGRNGK
jgi:hypothetical protein